MVIANADFEAQLLRALSSLPAGANPFTALSTELRNLVLPGFDQHAVNQLYALTVIFALITILSILSLFIRWRKGILWIVRRSSTGLLRFHFSASWTLPALVFLILLQPAMAYERKVFQREGRGDFMYWLGLPWLALAWSGIIATWAILSSHVVQMQARGKWLGSRTTLFVNSSGFLLLFIYTALLVPPAVLVGQSYDLLLQHLGDTATQLAKSAENWQGGIPNFAPSTPALQALSQAATTYFRDLQVLFSIFAIVSIVLAILMAIASYFYLSFLRRELKSMERCVESEQGLVLHLTSSQQKLRRVWTTIFFTVGVNIIIAFLLAVNSLVVAIEPSKLARRNHLRIALLLPLYAVGAFGLLSAAVLVVRAAQAAPSDEKLFKAACEVAKGSSGTERRKEMPHSEEATMVDSIDEVEKTKKDVGDSRRSSWFGGRKGSFAIPLSSKILVDVDVVVDEQRTLSSQPR